MHLISKSVIPNVPELSRHFRTNQPFPHIVIDGFLDPVMANALAEEIPDPLAIHAKKSNDFVFARNKYEISNLTELGGTWQTLYRSVTEDGKQLEAFLSELVGRRVWLDPQLHGGGLHLGGSGSYLDMHADFNVHPNHSGWFRDLNLLVYLNPRWTRDWGGELKMRSSQSGTEAVVEPLFNRCVIFETRDFTLHGYDPIRFPDGEYRTSVALYAYSDLAQHGHVTPRSTVWRSENSALKRALGRILPVLLATKQKILGRGHDGPAGRR